MKKKLSFFTTLLIVLTVGTLFFACSKSKSKKDETHITTIAFTEHKGTFRSIPYDLPAIDSANYDVSYNGDDVTVTFKENTTISINQNAEEAFGMNKGGAGSRIIAISLVAGKDSNGNDIEVDSPKVYLNTRDSQLNPFKIDDGDTDSNFTVIMALSGKLSSFDLFVDWNKNDSSKTSKITVDYQNVKFNEVSAGGVIYTPNTSSTTTPYLLNNSDTKWTIENAENNTINCTLNSGNIGFTKKENINAFANLNKSFQNYNDGYYVYALIAHPKDLYNDTANNTKKTVKVKIKDVINNVDSPDQIKSSQGEYYFFLDLSKYNAADGLNPALNTKGITVTIEWPTSDNKATTYTYNFKISKTVNLIPTATFNEIKGKLYNVDFDVQGISKEGFTNFFSKTENKLTYTFTNKAVLTVNQNVEAALNMATAHVLPIQFVANTIIVDTGYPKVEKQEHTPNKEWTAITPYSTEGKPNYFTLSLALSGSYSDANFRIVWNKKQEDAKKYSYITLNGLQNIIFKEICVGNKAYIATAKSQDDTTTEPNVIDNSSCNWSEESIQKYTLTDGTIAYTNETNAKAFGGATAGNYIYALISHANGENYLPSDNSTATVKINGTDEKNALISKNSHQEFMYLLDVNSLKDYIADNKVSKDIKKDIKIEISVKWNDNITSNYTLTIKTGVILAAAK